MDYSMPGLLVPHHVLKFAQVHVHWTDTMLFNHLILCHPLLLLPSIFPSIRVFPSESALLIRWSKYRSFSFSIFSSLAFSTNQQMLVPLPFLYILKFSIQVLLKPTLKDFEHNLTRMGNECNCLVVRTFFSTAIIRDWNENWPFRCVVVLNMSSVKLLLQLKQAASMEPTGNTHCCSSGSWCAFCCKDSPLSLCPADFDYLLDFS